jgi:hypothetical protein
LGTKFHSSESILKGVLSIIGRETWPNMYYKHKKIVGIAFLQRASVASKEIYSGYGFHKYPLLKDNELYRGLKAFLELIMFLSIQVYIKKVLKVKTVLH